MENESTDKKAPKSLLAEWLERLQQDSWQLELLISGFALYGIFESRSLFFDLRNYMSLNQNGILGWWFSMLLNPVLMLGWRIFFFNLLTHVVLRGLWIGAIGLRYVSSEIEFRNLGYSETFTRFLEKKVGSYDVFIERLEKICSVIFAYTFLLFMWFVSGVIFLVPGLFLTYCGMENLFESRLVSYILYYVALVYFLLGLMVFADFISLGGFKRIRDKTVSAIFLPVSRFYSTITLSFLYRPLFYNFIDKTYTRKLFLFSIPYFFVLIVPVLVSNNKYPHFPPMEESWEAGFFINDFSYGDLMAERLRYLGAAALKERKSYFSPVFLNKYYMDDPYPSLFFTMYPSDQDLLQKKKATTFFKGGLQWGQGKIKAGERNPPQDSLRWEEGLPSNEETFQAVLDNIQSLSDVRIDGVPYNDSLHCRFYLHPNRNERGILCHFSSAAISPGPHLLRVERTFFQELEDTVVLRTYSLPFIKEN